MTTLLTTARPYAVAAFEIAKSANQLALWSTVLKQLSVAVSDDGLSALIQNPLANKTQILDILTSVLHAASGNGSAENQNAFANFVRLLIEKKRLVLLPEISTLFEAAVAKESGSLSLVVTSAYEMDGEQKRKTEEKLAEKLNAKLNIIFDVDKNIIGGLLVRSGNWVLDDTVKGKLNRLKSVIGGQ
jgi:F-type H+-transporting ATPase subunit delta